MRILVIGIGGVGSYLIEFITRLLYKSELGKSLYPKIVLMDGDSFEIKNEERQIVTMYNENKATSTAEKYYELYKANIDGIPEYLTEENIKNFIKEEDVIFICTDNYKSRKMISDFSCENLKNFIIINGGNFYYDGAVQIHKRVNGKDIKPPITKYHKEIREANDKLPNEMSCEELMNSEPQLHPVNVMVATLMYWCFFNNCLKIDDDEKEKVVLKDGEVFEAYFDMRKMIVNPVV